MFDTVIYLSWGMTILLFFSVICLYAVQKWAYKTYLEVKKLNQILTGNQPPKTIDKKDDEDTKKKRTFLGSPL